MQSPCFVIVCLSSVFFLVFYASADNQINLKIGEFCNETAGDSCEDGLECLYMKCSCRTGEGYEWDSTRCVGRIGAACGTDNDCGQNGVCTELFCACAKGFAPTKDRHCAKSFGATCDQQKNECNTDLMLECTGNNACRCRDETMHLYEESTGFCGARVGQPCDPYMDFYGFPNGYTGKRCYSGAVCERDLNDPEGDYICQCAEGTYPNADNVCDTAGVAVIVALPTIALLLLSIFVNNVNVLVQI